MGYSREEYTYDGVSAQEWPVNFSLGFLDRADVRVYVKGELDGLGDQIFRTFTWLSDGLIRVTDPIAADTQVVIERTVSKDELEISLTNTGPITRDTLARGFTQLMMNIHELLDGRLDSFTGVLLDKVEGLRIQTLAYRDETLTIRDAAEVIRANAELERLAAETARLAAEAAQAAAEAEATQAGTERGLADAAKVAAQAAQGLAETAQAASEAARDLSLQYRDAAQAARDAAQAAQTGAETAETNAGTQATAAAGSASTAATEADRSKTEADNAAASAAAAAVFDPSTLITVPVGGVMHVLNSTVPDGFLKANGAALSRTAYEALFAVLGTTYGSGDGTTTFNLPDLRGEFIRGWDDGRGVDAGRAVGSSQDSENKAHSHDDTFSIASHNETFRVDMAANSSNGAIFANGSNVSVGGGSGSTSTLSTSGAQARDRLTWNINHSHSISGSVASAGGAEARPRNVAAMAVIRY